MGLKSLADYSTLIPGLVVRDGGSPGQATVTLRGIAAVGPGSVVGYYLGDTPMGSSGFQARATTLALDLMPYDLERMEVLRGPQGTLYGASSMGGLLKYVLREADTNGFSGRIGADLSQTEHGDGVNYGFRAAGNVPLGDTLAMRASIYQDHSAGYIDDLRLHKTGVNSNDRYGGRLALTWKPNDDFKLNLNALVTRIDSKDNARTTFGLITGPTQPNGLPELTPVPTYGEFGRYHAFAEPFKKDISYFSATMNWDVGAFDVVSATAWSHTTTERVEDMTPTYGYYTLLLGKPRGVSKINLSLDLQKFVQEVRLVSKGTDRFQWMVGGFFTDERSRNKQVVQVLDANYQPINDPRFSPYWLYGSLPTTYQEVAAFGNATYKFTEKADITLGVRYAHNTQDFHQITDGFLLGGAANVPGGSSEGVLTWMANARYHFTPDVMVYLRAATGYQPGGPNVSLPDVPPTVDAATLTSYEAGLRSVFWDGRASLNATAFYIDWNKIQLSTSNPQTTASYIDNAGDAFSKGVELEGWIKPIRGLRIGANATWTNAELTKLLPGAPNFLIGPQLPGVPEWAAGASIDYEWPVFADWRANIGGKVSYAGERWVIAPTASNFADETLDEAYTTLDLRAGLSNDRWSVTLFARNVTDERAYLSKLVLRDRVPPRPYYAMDATPIQPRVIGVSVNTRF